MKFFRERDEYFRGEFETAGARDGVEYRDRRVGVIGYVILTPFVIPACMDTFRANVVLGTETSKPVHEPSLELVLE